MAYDRRQRGRVRARDGKDIEEAGRQEIGRGKGLRGSSGNARSFVGFVCLIAATAADSVVCPVVVAVVVPFTAAATAAAAVLPFRSGACKNMTLLVLVYVLFVCSVAGAGAACSN